jgi:hypothetical protein
MNSMLKILAISVPLTASLGLPVHASVTEEVRNLNFNVFLDDREIGFQRFTVTPTAEGTRIDTEARFEVKFLRITAFAYDHRNTELWRDGCLQAITARTDSNGKQQVVNGRDRGSAFVVATAEGEQRLGDCVASFAYWDRNLLLQRQRLLNSQTGEYTPVRIDRLGQGQVRIPEREVTVQRYAIRGQGIDISLAYTVDGGEWVSLDSKLESGRTLRYRRSPVELTALN